MDKCQCYLCENISIRGEPRCKINKIHNPKGGSAYKPCSDIPEDKCEFRQVIAKLPVEIINFYDYLDERVKRGIMSEYTVYTIKLTLWKCLVAGYTIEDLLQTTFEEITENIGRFCDTCKGTTVYAVRSFRQYLGVY